MEMNGCKVEFASRHTNKVADRLAKVCLTDVIGSFNLEYFEQTPGFVADVFWEDKPP